MSALEQVRQYQKDRFAAGKQVSWNVGFITARPALKHIRYWFPDLPVGFTKAQATEWLAEKALSEITKAQAA